MTFGLYEWCPIKGRSEGELRLREGSRELGRLYGAWPDGLKQLREYARGQRGAAGGAAGGGAVGTEAGVRVAVGEGEGADEQAAVGLLGGHDRR